MKSTIEFALPEEKEELQAALKGSLYKARIDELYDQVFRPHIRYGKSILKSKNGNDRELTSQQLAVIEQLWKKVAKHLEDVLE